MVTTTYGDDRASVCAHGHVINPFVNQVPSENKPFCAICGSPAVSRCPHCQAPIDNKSGLLLFTPPDHCPDCGSRMPWLEEVPPHAGPQDKFRHAQGRDQTAANPANSPQPGMSWRGFPQSVLASVVGSAVWAFLLVCLVAAAAVGGAFLAFGRTPLEGQMPSPTVTGAASTEISASTSAPRSLIPTPPPSPGLSPTPVPTETCSDSPADWPKTPQEAASDFGGRPYNWYPDYFQVNGGPVQWDKTTWVFQDSPLQPGVTLRADGNYIDANGTVLGLVTSLRGDKLWNYYAPLDYPTLHLGQFGLEGRAHMFVRTDSRAAHNAMTKRWGYGSAVFQESQAGVVRLVWCNADQLDAARQDTLKEYDGPDPDQGYTDLMWDEHSGQFSQPPKST